MRESRLPVMVDIELAGSQAASASGVRFHRCCSIAHGVAHTEGDIEEREVVKIRITVGSRTGGYKLGEQGFRLNASINQAVCKINWRCKGQDKLPGLRSWSCMNRTVWGSQCVRLESEW
jgi:hypothetical protein